MQVGGPDATQEGHDNAQSRLASAQQEITRLQSELAASSLSRDGLPSELAASKLSHTHVRTQPAEGAQSQSAREALLDDADAALHNSQQQNMEVCVVYLRLLEILLFQAMTIRARALRSPE